MPTYMYGIIAGGALGLLVFVLFLVHTNVMSRISSLFQLVREGDAYGDGGDGGDDDVELVGVDSGSDSDADANAGNLANVQLMYS